MLLPFLYSSYKVTEPAKIRLVNIRSDRLASLCAELIYVGVELSGEKYLEISLTQLRGILLIIRDLNYKRQLIQVLFSQPKIAV